ncbi:MAG: hypothetical protein ABJO67_04140 [Pseudoruegeria sp.]
MVVKAYLNAAIATALVGMVAGAGWQGYRMGHAACEAAHNAETLARIEAAQKLDAERINVARTRDELARMLEEQAHADPIIVQRCLNPDRVRRLNSLR